MSDALVAVGFSCMVGMGILAEHVIFRQDSDIELVTTWLSRFLELVNTFLKFGPFKFSFNIWE